MASTTAPTSAQRSGLLSRIQPHTRYPPPISQRPASTNKTPTKSNLDILELLSAILSSQTRLSHTRGPGRPVDPLPHPIPPVRKRRGSSALEANGKPEDAGHLL